MANPPKGPDNKDGQESFGKTPDWIQRVVQYVLPITAKSLNAVNTSDPRSVLYGMPHKWYALLLTLILCSILTVTAYCSGQYVPNRYPFDMLWSDLEGFVTPKIDYAFVAQLLLYPIALGCVSFLVCWLSSRENAYQRPNKNKKLEEEYVRDLLASCAIFASIWVFLGAISLASLSWAINYVVHKYIKSASWLAYHLYYDTLAFYLTILFVIVMPFKIRNVLNKAKIQLVRPWGYGLFISFMVGFGSLMCGTFVMQHFDSTYLKRGQATGKMYELPVSGVVQTCEKNQSKLNCTIALFPERQQNFEYFGTWTLGRLPQSGSPNTIMLNTWQPALQVGRAIPTVILDEQKDESVDISADSSDICKNPIQGGETDAFFFFVKGRAKGERMERSRDLRIRIDNNNPKFAQLIATACK